MIEKLAMAEKLDRVVAGRIKVAKTESEIRAETNQPFKTAIRINKENRHTASNKNKATITCLTTSAHLVHLS